MDHIKNDIHSCLKSRVHETTSRKNEEKTSHSRRTSASKAAQSMKNTTAAFSLVQQRLQKQTHELTLARCMKLPASKHETRKPSKNQI